MSLFISKNLVVSMHYKLTDDDGNILDTSEGAEPLNYLHGAGNIIPGLETAIIGKSKDAELTVRIEAADAYGGIDKQLIQTVEKSTFQGVTELEESMQFETQSPDGHVRVIVVKQIDGDNVIVDANHPLAGIALTFDVKIVNIREASKEEIAHGHVH